MLQKCCTTVTGERFQFLQGNISAQLLPETSEWTTRFKKISSCFAEIIFYFDLPALSLTVKNQNVVSPLKCACTLPFSLKDITSRLYSVKK
jgi:hypothetical protein